LIHVRVSMSLASKTAIDRHTHLIAWAQYRQRIRAFFEARDVLEVVTPHQTSYTGTDVHLTPFQGISVSGQQWFLHTSPEFEMKKLLAQGSGDIFQICQVFRDEEQGQWHHPEFTLLEWYRQGWTLDALMEEVALLCAKVFKLNQPVTRLSVHAACERYAGWSPWAVDALKIAQSRWPHADCGEDQALWFDWVMVTQVEPKLADLPMCCLYDYPETHAALAKVISFEGRRIARRFEYYVQGIEVANGFDELGDAVEQRHRFEQEQAMRRVKQQPVWPIDTTFLDALDKMPECCGVALGLDRLYVLAQNNL